MKTLLFLIGLSLNFIANAQNERYLDQNFGTNGVIIIEPSSDASHTNPASLLMKDDEKYLLGFGGGENYIIKTLGNNVDRTFANNGIYKMNTSYNGRLFSGTFSNSGKIIYGGRKLIDNYRYHTVIYRFDPTNASMVKTNQIKVSSDFHLFFEGITPISEDEYFITGSNNAFFYKIKCKLNDPTARIEQVATSYNRQLSGHSKLFKIEDRYIFAYSENGYPYIGSTTGIYDNTNYACCYSINHSYEGMETASGINYFYVLTKNPSNQYVFEKFTKEFNRLSSFIINEEDINISKFAINPIDENSLYTVDIINDNLEITKINLEDGIIDYSFGTDGKAILDFEGTISSISSADFDNYGRFVISGAYGSNEVFITQTIPLSNTLSSVQHNTESSVILFPNPIKEKLNLKGIQEVEKIEIYNMAGSLIKKIILKHSKTAQIDISDISKGMYFIKLYKKDSMMVRKISKK